MTPKRMAAIGLLGSCLQLPLAHADLIMPPPSCQPDVRTIRPRGPVVLQAGAAVRKAGMRPGDELISVDGRTAMDEGVLEGPGGSRLKIEYERERAVDSAELVRDVCAHPAAGQAAVCRPDMSIKLMQSFVVLGMGSLAQQKGLRKGDHILLIEGKAVGSGRSLDEGLWTGASGTPVNITVWQRETERQQELQLIRERCSR